MQELVAQGLEALEGRVMLSGSFYSARPAFMADVRVGQVAGIDFDTLPAGTNLTGVTVQGVKFNAPASSPLEVLNAAGGVRNPMSASSGTRVLSPGGTNATLQDDDLEIVFDKPVQAAGLDVVFDAPDGASFTGVTFYNAAGAVLYTASPIGAPSGAPGYQFVGYASNGDDIKRIVFDEFDDSAADDNIAYDSLVFTTPTIEIEPVSYDMPNGASGQWNYSDESYTGSGDRAASGAALSGGLGQLTDDRVGTSDIAQSLTFGSAWEWVGWSSVTPTITFDFGRLVSLDGASVHASNQRSRGDLSIFGTATVQFSTDGVNYGDTFTYTTDSAERADTTARFVDLVFHRDARYVKMTFADADLPWVFISEIDFFQKAAGAGASYDAAADLSAQNPSGPWAYGHTNILGTSMTLYPNVSGSGENLSWNDPSHISLGAPSVWRTGSSVNFHPGTYSMDDYSVIRWTAPASGVVEWDASFTSIDYGHKQVFVYQNQSQLFAGAISGSSTTGNQGTRMVSAGDQLAVLVGPGDGDFYNDATRVAFNIEYVTQAPLIALNFDSGVDSLGAGTGNLVFNGADGFQVTFTDDESAGAEGGNAGGVHLTDAGYGNRRAGSGNLVLGAYNDAIDAGNRHSSGIVAKFNRGAAGVSLVDADDDTTAKTLFAYNRFGQLIGQTVAGSQRTFSITTAETGGQLIYGVEFDTAAGTAGGSNDGTYFTVDDFVVTGSADAPEPDRVLFVNLGGSYTADGANFYNTLPYQGIAADYVLMDSPGKVVAALAASAYDQVWVYDLNSGDLPAAYDADLNAIGDWYNAQRLAGKTANIIADGRVISSYWSGRWADEGRRLSANYYANLRDYGDIGLVLGTDHDAFHPDINTINARLNIQPFVGNFNLSTIPVDTAHPLMTTPYNLGSTLFDDSSPGQTPFGLQPNGQILYTVAWHSGDVNTPGISSTISGAVGFAVEIASPVGGSTFLQGQGVTFTAAQANGTGPFTYTWSSSLDGELGTGQTLQVSTLRSGTHTITLLGQDTGGGGADTATISLVVQPLADLAPINLAAPASGGTGRTITVQYDIGNTGSADAGAFEEGIFLSTDATFDAAADTLLGTVAHTTLAAGTQQAVSKDVVLPDVPAGNYFLLVVTNRNAPVPEVDNADNLASSALAVTDGIAPALVSFAPSGWLNQDVTAFTVTFSEAMDAATFGAVDIVVTLPDGSTLPTAQLAVAATADPAIFTVSLATPLSAEGQYQVKVGPSIADLAGNNMIPLSTAVVYQNDFQAGAGANWTNAVVDTANATYTAFLGRYDNNAATLTLNSLPDHAQVTLQFDLYIIDSWDGSSTTYGPDYFGFTIDGAATAAWEHTFTGSGANQTYPGLPDIGPAQLGYSSWTDSGYRNVSFTFSHTAGSLALAFRGRNLQGVADESWGLDNVKVTLNGTQTRTFVIDKTPPTVSGATLSAGQAQVTYADASGVDTATATSAAHYLLIASGGDGTFGDGNEVAIDIPARLSGAIQFDPATQRATLNFGSALPDEIYRLTVKGPSGIRDIAGNAMAADYASGDLAVNAVGSTVSIDLKDGSDSGVSNTDNLTNAASLAIAVNVNEAGVITLDVDDDGTAETTRQVLAGGTYELVAPAPAGDGAHSARATFTPLVGTAVSAALSVTVDRQGPVASDQGAPTVQAPVGTRTVKFSEPIDAASLGIDDVTLAGPAGPVTVTGISGLGDTFTVQFAPATAAGAYELTLGPDVRDRAGNAMGAALVAPFQVVADTAGPSVEAITPTGLVNSAVSSVRVRFDEFIDGVSFTGADVSIAGPGGVVGPITVTAFQPAQYAPLSFGSSFNNRWQTMGVNMGGIPTGDITLGGIPFSTPTGTGNNIWSAAYGGANPHVLEIPVGIFGVTELHTLINTSWGARGPASYASVEFIGSAGAFYSKSLVGNVDLRDYNYNPSYTTTINGTTTTEVWNNGGGQHLDKQQFILPAEFAGQTLLSVRIVDNGGDSLQRMAVYGATAVTSATTQTNVFDVSFPTQSADGAYTVSIGPSVTDLSGNAMAAAFTGGWTIDRTGPRIVFAEPSLLGDEVLDHIDVRFDSPIAAGSFTAADVALTGPSGSIAISGITQIGATTYRIGFGAQSAPGAYQLSVGPAVLDAAGNAMDQDADGTPGEAAQDVFRHAVSIADLAGPYVVSLAPMLPVQGPVSTMRVTFSEDINADTFTLADVSIAGGAVVPTGLTAADGRTFDITFPGISADGRYAVRIGPDITDLAGNAMLGGDRAYATQLIFEPAAADGSTVPAAYGDRVASTSDGGFVYGGALPFTPGIVVDYGQNLGRAGTGFGTLANVVYAASGTTLQVTLTSDAGELVALHALDLAAAGDADLPIRSLQVLGEGSVVLSSYTGLLVDADDFTRVDFGDGVMSRELVIRIDADNLGSVASRIGLDNIVFSQVGAAAAPPPAAFVSGFTVDSTGPRIVSMAPAGTATTFFDHVDVTFDGVIDAATLTLADIAIAGPGGPVSLASVTRLDGTTWRIALTGPAQAVGTYQVTVGPDVRDALGNPMAAAFAGAVSLQLPDLTIDAIHAPTSGLFGQPLQVEWSVRNLTAYASAATWSDSIYLSKDAVLDAGDELLLAVPAAPDLPVAGNGAYARSVPVPLPLRVDLPDGRYYLFVKTNPASAQPEPDTTNNASEAVAVDLVTPDVLNLVVSDISVPPTARAGDTVSVQWTIRNAGQADFTGVWEDRLFLSLDGAIGNDSLVAIEPFAGSIAKGQSIVRSALVTLPSNSDADRWVVVTTDATNLVNEHANEGDNTSIDDAKIDVSYPPLPDLVVESVTASGGLQSGQPLKIDWIIRNTGSDSAAAAWTDRIVLKNVGLNQQIAALSIPWSQQTPQGALIGAGQAMSGTWTLTLPDGPLGTGSILVTVSTDISNTIFEVNPAGTGESNNDGSATITTTAGPTADLRAVSIAPPDAQIWAGRSIAASWEVASEGQKAAAGDWLDRVYLRPMAGGADLSIGTAANPGSLPVGESYVRAATFAVPGGLSGEYRLVLRANHNAGLYEQDTLDNEAVSAPFNISIPPASDLAVTQIVVPDVDIRASGLAEIRWTVTNQGQASTNAPRWNDRLYLSADAVLDANDFPLTPLVENPRALAAGESYQQRVEFALPQTAAGDYYVIVVADAQGQLAENSESNNTRVSDTTFTITPVVPARLEVTDLTVLPANPWRGDQVTLQWKLINAGELSTGDLSFDHAIALSDNDTLEQGRDRTLQWHIARVQLNLAPGQKSDVLTTTVQLPPDVEGEKYLIVWVDPPNWANVARSNGSTAITIEPGFPSDLVVDRVVAPATGLAGFPISVSWAVRNASVQPTRAGNWNDRVILSADTDPATQEDNVLLGDFIHNGDLRLDQVYSRNVQAYLPTDMEGTYHVFVQTNADGRVLEDTFTDNNTAEAAGTIAVSNRPPDLTVVNATFGASAGAAGALIAGQTITVSWSMLNDGTGPVPAESWASQVWLSPDGTLAGATLLGQRSHQLYGFAAGASVNFVDSFVLPHSFAGKDAHVVIRVDSAGQVQESSELNNTIEAGFTGGDRRVVSPPADLTVTSVGATVSGGSLTASWTVLNTGGITRVNSWLDRVYVSADAIFDPATDPIVGEFAHGGILGNSAVYNGLLQGLALPVGMGGTVHVFVKADASDPDFVDESNENNNVGYRGVPQVDPPQPPAGVPDLTVPAFDPPATLYSGQRATIAFQVANPAANDAVGTWYDAVYLSLDQFLDAAQDTLLGNARRSNLAAGGTYTAAIDVQLPRGISGPYYLIAVADMNRTLLENSEPNNVRAATAATQVQLTPEADLVVDAATISVPATGFIGQPFTATWTVRNQGGEALGRWSDSVYLSADGAWDVSDVKVGDVLRDGPVAGGGSYNATLKANVPGLLPGAYHLIVVTDIRDEVREQLPAGEANNAAVSVGMVQVDAQPILPGGTAQGTLAQGQSAYYRIDLAEGQTLQLAMDSESLTGVNELYISFGEVPTRGRYQFSADPFVPDPLVLVPAKQSGAYYILAYAASVQGTPTYTLSADLLPFSIRAVSTDSAGQTGPFTLKIDGALFDGSTSFELHGVAGQVVVAREVFLQDSITAYATFNLAGFPAGEWTLHARRGDGSVASYDAPLLIETGEGADLRARVTGPGAARAGRINFMTVEYGNEGDIDAFPPLLILYSDTGTPIGLLPEDVAAGRQIQLLGTPQDGPADRLRPASKYALPAYFLASTERLSFQVRKITTSTNTPITDWSVIESAIRPANLTDAQWQPFWDQIRPRIGTTWGEYAQLLNRMQMMVVQNGGDPIHDVRKLFAAVYGLDSAFVPSANISGTLYDSDSGNPLPGVELHLYSAGILAGSVTTDGAGRFRFDYLAAGDYSLSAAYPAYIDQDRDGTSDAAMPRIILKGSDVEGLSFFGSAGPTTGEAAAPTEGTPSVAVDSAGIAHMAWTRNGAIWHATFDGTRWVGAAPIPGAKGADVRLRAAANLIDGNDAGMIALWQSAKNNAAELQYSIGRPAEGGGYEWSEPATLTDNDVVDAAPAVLIDSSGRIVSVYQRYDYEGNDDADLYFSAFDINSADLSFPVAQPVALALITPQENDPAAFTVEIGGNIGTSIAGVPIIGGASGAVTYGLLDGKAYPCSATASGSLESKLSALGDLLELKGGGSASASWNKNTQTQQWEFSSATLSGSISLGINVPILAIFIPQLLATAEVSVGGSASASISASWDSSHPLGGPASSRSSSMEYSVSITGEVKVFFGIIAGAKVTGSGSVSATDSTSGGKLNQAKLKLDAEISSLLGWVKVKKGWEWVLAENKVSGLSVQDSQLIPTSAPVVYTLANPAATNAVILPDGTLVELAYAPGTGRQYGTNALLGDVSGDLFNDGPAALAEGPGGQIMAAWAKDGDIAQGQHGRVMVSRLNGNAWSAPVPIPGSDGYNSEVKLSFDGQGRAIAAWRHVDMTGLDLQADPQAVFDAIRDGRLVYSVLDNGQWSAPMPVFDTGLDQRQVALGEGADGKLVASWVQPAGAGERLMTSLWDGSNWSAPITVVQSAQPFSGPAEISAISGRTVIFWSQPGNADANNMGIRYALLQSIAGNPTWSTPITFTADAGSSFFTGLSVSETGGSTAVAEGGASDTISLVLNGAPDADVTVTLQTDQVTAGPNTITFTPGNWNVPQSVTISAIDDALVEGRHTGQVSFTLTSADVRYNGSSANPVTVSIADNEKARILITESAGRTDVSEDGLTDTYTITLSDQPDSDVTIALFPDGQVTVSPPGPITFTQANWNVPRVITVAAVNDAAVEGPHQGRIRHSVSTSDPLYAGVVARDVLASIADNEDGRIVLAGGSGIEEHNETRTTYTVRLADQPTSSVRVYLWIDDGQTRIVSFESMLFTPDDWNDPREVRIEAVDDGYDEGGWHNGRVHHMATSLDPRYNNLPGPDYVASILDDDTAGVEIQATGPDTEVAEGGKTDTYLVRLTSAPFYPVSMQIFTDGQTTTSPSALSFSDGDWSSWRTVTVTAVDDAVFGEGRHLSGIRHEYSSQDPAYNGVAGHGAWVLDNEVGHPGVSIIQTDGTTHVQEAGHDDTIFVVLTGRPSTSVTVTLSSMDGEAMISPGSASFSSGDWNQPREMTVSAPDDGDDDEGLHAGWFRVRVSGDPGFDGIEFDFVVGISDVVVLEGGTSPITGGAGGGAGGIGGPPPTDPCKKDDPPHEPEPVYPTDPNDILGPEGFGEQRWLSAANFLDYTIRFENQPSASAPAQEVSIVQQLDPDLDWRTFQLGEFGWADHLFQPGGARPNLFRRIDLTATDGFYVDVTAGIDLAAGTLTWTFTTVDPLTGDKPLDAFAGFLAVNDANGIGEGFVKYRIRPKTTAPTRSVLDAQATIVFDTQGPIDTPPIANLLDTAGPATAVAALPPTHPAGDFIVSWAGNDGEGSGIASYDLFVSTDGGPFQVWLDNTTATSAAWAGVAGHSYAFYSVGMDNVGNQEAAPAAADATTTVRESTAPFVTDALIQDGMAQRSYVDRLRIAFSEPVNIADLIADGVLLDAVSLTNLGTNAPIDPDVPVALSPSQFRYDESTQTLSWSLDSFSGGTPSLVGGAYELRLNGSKIVDLSGNPLEADFVLHFHRLQGDVTGDAAVNAADQELVDGSLGLRSTDPDWNANADTDRSGQITTRDRVTVARALGATITPMPAVPLATPDPVPVDPEPVDPEPPPADPTPPPIEPIVQLPVLPPVDEIPIGPIDDTPVPPVVEVPELPPVVVDPPAVTDPAPAPDDPGALVEPASVQTQPPPAMTLASRLRLRAQKLLDRQVATAGKVSRSNIPRLVAKTMRSAPDSASPKQRASISSMIKRFLLRKLAERKAAQHAAAFSHDTEQSR